MPQDWSVSAGCSPLCLPWARFDRICRDRPQDFALWSRGEARRLSFAELAQGVGAWRRRLGSLPRELVGLALGNTVAAVEVVLAALGEGLPIVLLDAGLSAPDLLALCRRLGIPGLVHRCPDLDGEDFRDARFTRLGGLEPAALPPGTALVKLTSGSTGQPVGVCLSGETLAAGIAQIAGGMEITGADRVLIAIPLSHSYGFDNGTLSLAALGTPLVLESSFYPAAIHRALAEGGATVFPAVPPMVRALAQLDWPPGLPLRLVISAGGPLAPEFAHQFRQRSGRWVHQFYGSTETGGISFEAHPEDPASLGTVGRPLPGVEVRLGEDGTVVVDSAANLVALLGEAPRADRRVALADRGEWTAEGRLRLVGRAAELFKVGGRRVSATALEEALRRLPGVEDAAVVGIDDPVRGDRVVAFVVGPERPPDASQLPAGLAARDVRSVASLPYTERGKLDRSQLKRLAAGGR